MGAIALAFALSGAVVEAQQPDENSPDRTI